MRGARPMTDGSRDFDFLIGTWDSANRKLARALAGSTDWDEFPGRFTCRPIFGGAGNVEEVIFPTRGNFGLTVRLFDPERQDWSLYWVSSRSSTIESLVVGHFVDGVGEFFCDDVYEGTPIRCRYQWSRITPTSAHWEQAFSTDGERSWETNWVNDMTRTGSDEQ
jgi:hypothetical protein